MKFSLVKVLLRIWRKKTIRKKRSSLSKEVLHLRSVLTSWGLSISTLRGPRSWRCSECKSGLFGWGKSWKWGLPPRDWDNQGKCSCQDGFRGPRYSWWQESSREQRDFRHWWGYWCHADPEVEGIKKVQDMDEVMQIDELLMIPDLEQVSMVGA